MIFQLCRDIKVWFLPSANALFWTNFSRFFFGCHEFSGETILLPQKGFDILAAIIKGFRDLYVLVLVFVAIKKL